MFQWAEDALGGWGGGEKQMLIGLIRLRQESGKGPVPFPGPVAQLGAHRRPPGVALGPKVALGLRAGSV